MTSVLHVNNLIDGKFIETKTYLESKNPATEEINALIADSSPEDAEKAIQAARQAFPG